MYTMISEPLLHTVPQVSEVHRSRVSDDMTTNEN